MEKQENIIELEIHFDLNNEQIFVAPQYWDDKVIEEIKKIFSGCEIGFPPGTEHVGQKRDFCG